MSAADSRSRDVAARTSEAAPEVTRSFHKVSARTACGESSWVSCAPELARMPIITSLSTRFFGQPRLTKPTFVGVTEVSELLRDFAGSSVTAVICSDDMQALILSSKADGHH